MATTAKLILDMRRMKKDGTFPIALRIIHQRIPLYLAYDYSVIPDHWDASGNAITNKCKKYSERKRINNFLLKQLVDATSVIELLSTSGELDKLSPAELKNKIQNKESRVTFRMFTQKIIDELTTAKKFGNASCYFQALNFFSRYTDDIDYTFDKITYKLLKHIETQHLSKGNSLNSLSFYFRTIRAIYNRAIKEGVAKRDDYPFMNYSIKETKTAKRRISKSDIEKIAKIELEYDTNLWHARNYFMFSFFNMGMNFIDIAYLKMSNTINGRVHYTRAKTGKLYSIKISEPAQHILSYYTEGKNASDFVFNIVSGETPEKQLLSFTNVRRRYTKWLKNLGKHCGIEANLTSYVARHSWASIAKDLYVPISVISEGLGHEDTKTTQIYLDCFDDDVLDKANQLIIG